MPLVPSTLANTRSSSATENVQPGKNHGVGGLDHGVGHLAYIPTRLLLDSRVVDLSTAYHLTLVILSSLKPLFFNRLKDELRFLDNGGA
jgi:hypothetical protein